MTHPSGSIEVLSLVFQATPAVHKESNSAGPGRHFKISVDKSAPTLWDSQLYCEFQFHITILDCEVDGCQRVPQRFPSITPYQRQNSTYRGIGVCGNSDDFAVCSIDLPVEPGGCTATRVRGFPIRETAVSASAVLFDSATRKERPTPPTPPRPPV